MDEENQDSIRYAFNRKIMISSVIGLLVVCFVIVLFHVYARWLRRQFRRHNRRRRRLDASATVISCQGLDLCAMNSLPTFVYESKNQESPLECAVCLSEFDDNETGRILPECKHCFHVDCIDMWLRSHCDCPLCRAQVNVRPVSNPEPIEDPDHVIVSIDLLEDMGSGSDSGLHPTCQSDGIHTGCSSSTSGTLDVLRQLTDPMEQDPTKKEGDPDSDGNIGSDIESGSKTPVRSARVLKRLFSI